MPCFGVDHRFIPNTQLDRIQPARDCQLVHRGFQREHTGTLARRTHPPRRRHIEPCKAVRGRAVRRGIHHTCGDGGLLGEFLNGRGLLNNIMCNRCQPTGGVCAQADTLDRRRAIAGHRKHVLSREGELHRATYHLRGHHGEDDMWMSSAFGAKSPADMSRATRATAMSDGCVAIHASDAPRMARLR